jgi:MATE family multidrug resistance protein
MAESAEQIDHRPRSVRPRDALAMVLTRLGMASMGLVDIVLLARHGTGDLAAAALVETTMGRALDVGAAGIGATLPLLAAAAPALRLGLWRRVSVLVLGWGVVMLVLALSLGGLLRAIGQSEALASLAARLALIFMPGALAALLAMAAAVWLEVSGGAGRVASAMVVANLANLGLDLWLIPQAGAAGSALATLIVRTGLMVVLVAMVLRANRGLVVQAPVMAGLRKYVATAAGIAAAMHGLGLVLTMLAARLGPASLAAYAAGWSLNLPAMIVASGLGDALSARVAQGAAWVGWLLRSSLLFVALAALFAAGTGLFAHAVSHDAAVQGQVQAILPLVALVLAFDAVNLLLIGALRGAGWLTGPGVVHIAGMAAAVALATLRTSLAGIVAVICLTSLARVLLMAAYALTHRRQTAIRGQMA